MGPLVEEFWAMGPGVLFLIAAAFCQWGLKRVPNALCLGFLMGALALAAASSFGAVQSAGGLGSSLLGLTLGFAMLLPLYARGMGAGCVKAQAVFGAWVGCALPAAQCALAVFATTLLGAALTQAFLWLAWQWVSCEDREGFEFPAQVTLSLGSLIGVGLFLNFSM
jgi:Flp pilus assembly protein protease CpaA